ncbi:MAG TPA: carbohydrate kinase family protein [Fimbriimonadaceae bacterium]|nr:carbohydrate kinase family protein [Fimbriimonadaceae bacterium]
MADILCAGHICLDIIPTLKGPFRFDPGRLVEVGPPTVSTGGCVPNTGLALNRLGASVELCGRVGDDAFGRLILDVLKREGLPKPIRLTPGAQTSYTVVVNPPDRDRMFLHFPGANAEFGAEDLPEAVVEGAKIVHLGYPPLLRRLYLEQGEEVCRIFERAHAAGAATSLDMTFPDVTAESGRVDWRAWLANVLPHCDLFVPSAPELAFMLGLPGAGDPVPLADARSLADAALDLGAGLVALKNGASGLYVKSRENLAHPHIPASWSGREHYEPSFEVMVVGATGAGDATVAGFLRAMLQAFDISEAARIAVGAGACCVERPDALSGIPSWLALQDRLAGGWAKR